MADIKYKKGELLFNGDITTINPNNDTCAHINASIVLDSELNQDILVAEINGVEYVCEAVILNSEKMYGGITQTGLDFTKCPLFFNSYITDAIKLGAYSENPGTYNLKIYTAVEDSDSAPLSPTDFIIAYLMKSPQNSNWNVLSSMLGDGDWSKLKKYVETTPHNMNRMVLESLLGSGSGNSNVVGSAIVGTAVVG